MAARLNTDVMSRHKELENQRHNTTNRIQDSPAGDLRETEIHELLQKEFKMSPVKETQQKN